MMNFFSKIFGSMKHEEEAAPEKETINFPELDAWFGKKTKHVLDPVRQDMKESFGQMRKISGELDTCLRNLERAKADENNEERVKHFAINNREALVKKVRAFNSRIQFPDAENVLESTKFNENLGLELNKLLQDTAKNIHFTNMLFSEEVKELNTTVRRFGFFFGKSQKIVDENAEKLTSVFRAEKKIREIKALMDAQKIDREQLSQTGACIEKLEAEEKALRKEIKSMDESEELALLEKLKAEKESLESEKSQIEAQVLQMFSPLGKALRKYGRYSSGLDKNDAALLDVYLDAPLRALLADSERKTLAKILENMEMLINAGRIDLKGKQKDKACAQIAALKKSSGIERAISDYKKLRKKTEDAENRIQKENIIEKIGAKKDELSIIESRIDAEKQKIQKLNGSIENSAEALAKKISELEPLLGKISGREVNIEFLN